MMNLMIPFIFIASVLTFRRHSNGTWNGTVSNTGYGGSGTTGSKDDKKGAAARAVGIASGWLSALVVGTLFVLI